MRALILILAAIAAAGCSDTTVPVGDPGQKGVVRTDIDRANGVASEASASVKQGNAATNDQ